MDLGSNRVILLPWPRDLECVSREGFGSKRRKPWLGFFSVCATNLQIIIHPDLPSFEESFTRAVFHAYSFVDYTRGSRKEIRGKPLLSCAISCAKSRTK